MKRATITGVRQAAVVDAPQPHAKADWALVRVDVAPLCTEFKGYLAGQRADYLGHEAAGEVVEVAQPGQVQVGDRVVVMPQYPCGGCPTCLAGDYIHCEQGTDVTRFTGSPEGGATIAQYLLKPDWLLPRIPPQVSTEHAAMACCGMGPTFGAMQRLAVDAFDTVLITGLGPVGLGGVINARCRGARVVGVEANAWRAARALALGAEVVLTPQEGDLLPRLRALTDGLGVDKAIDCSGHPAAHRLCLEATRRLGGVAFVGECSDDTPLRVSPDLIRKGLTVCGSWHYNRRDVPRLLGTIAALPALLNELISHEFPLDSIGQAWELQATGNCAKVLIRPWR